MPSSITRLTALDHDRMLRLVRRATSPGPSQERWRDELVHLVRAHLDAERESLSADVVAQAGPTAVQAGNDLGHLEAELRERCAEMAECEPGSPDVLRLGEEIAAIVTMHADLLSERVLAPLEEAVARKEIRRLGGVYAETRDRALRDEGEADPPPRRLDLSRAELYELAKKAGIAGRSAMSRKDLIAELQRRQQTS